MKRILITGGSRGIGAALVRAFTARGDAVAFLYRSSHDAAARLEKETGATAIAANICDPVDVARAVATARDALGGDLDVLVNNAGVSLIALTSDVTDADWRRVIDTDLSGAFYLVREVEGDMIRKGAGRIINIGSMWGKVGASMEVAYSAAKAGLRGLTMSLAKELGPSGITVNCVEPGVIDTDMNRSLDEETRAALIEDTPLSRIGTPDDITPLVLFLTTDGASFITGQCIGADGGFAI